MAIPLKVLILEDRATDAELVLYELRRAGFVPEWLRVETEPDYLAHLEPVWDLILADYSLPQFDALRALDLLQARKLDIPFIIVSANIGEDIAVAAMKQGAADYLLKDRLTRLGQAVSHALEGQKQRQEKRQAEEAQRESEERYRLLFESNPQPMWVYDLETLAFLAVNDAAVHHYGYTRTEFLGMTIKDIRPQAEIGKLLDNIASSANDYNKAGIWIHQKKNGSLIDVEITSHRLNFGGRSAELVLANDITERLQAETRLLKSEERYRRLVETAPDAIYTISITDGTITGMNPAGGRITGHLPEEMIGKRYTDFVHSDDVPTANAVFQGILQGEQSFSYELRVKTKLGEYAVVEFTTIPQTENGEVVGILGIARDITERKRAEEERLQLQAAIAKSAFDWQITFDAIESPVLILEREGRINKLNDAAMQMIGGDGQVGQLIANLGDSAVWQTAAELVDLIRETHTSDTCQARDTASGRTWDLAASVASGLEEADDRIILVIREVTRLVELQASLHRSETMSLLGSLVSGVAHEVRNPLFAISSTLDAFEARFGSTEGCQKYTSVLHGEVNRLNDLMKDLLEYGRPHNRQLNPGSIEDVITQAVNSCALLAKRAEVKVVSQFATGLPLINMDSKRLLQVFLNLLENAIQHLPVNGVVTVESKEIYQDQRQWIVCTVKDTGPGFQTDDLPRLFEPFFTRRRGGTGLGLSIVQKIVEEHGGKISAGNRLEGGALISVKLPIRAAIS